MKKLGYFLLAALVGSAMSACGDDGENGETGPKETPFDLTIAVSDVATYDAKITVTPNNDSGLYYAKWMTKAEFTAAGGNDTGVAAFVAAMLKEVSTTGGGTIDAAVKNRSLSGKKELTADLKPDTEYVAYAFGWDAQGKPISTVKMATFKSKAAPKVGGMTITTDKGTSLIYPNYDNSPATKIAEFTYVTSYGGKEARILLSLVHEVGKCTVSYDATATGGEPMKVVFALNADGFPETATSYYASDDTKAKDASFAYENKLLTKVIDDPSDVNSASTIFLATYDAAKDYTTLRLQGESGYEIASSTVVNNLGVDPVNFLVAPEFSPLVDFHALAACCGLLPRAAHFPGVVAGELPVVVEMKDGKMVKFGIEELLMLDYTYAE